MNNETRFAKTGFIVTLLLILLIVYGWPAILIGIGGVLVIDHVKSSERIDPSKINFVKGAVEIKTIRAQGDKMVAVIKNTYSTRVYNLRLACSGGPSLRDTSGWLNPGEQRQFAFAMIDSGAHTDCVVGFEIDDEKIGPGPGERNFEDSLTAAVEPIFKGSRITVSGSIVNYSKQRISGVRLACYFSEGGVDAQYKADVAASASPQATGAVSGSFSMPYAPPNGIFCKVVSAISGEFYR